MAHRPAEYMTIGRLAKAGSVGVETVRYYQRRGLLPVPQSRGAGFRRYGPETLARLHGIKRAQQAGFTLAEIAVLLRLDRRRDRHAAHRLAIRKIADIDQQIDALCRLRQTLDELARECERGNSDLPCPIIESIGGSDSARTRRGEAPARQA